jgi:TPR repeat protein
VVKIGTYRFFALLLLFISPLSASASGNPPPRITVAELFSEVIISNELEGWSVTGLSDLQVWPRTVERQEKLIELNKNNAYILSTALTVKPVIVDQVSDGFFSGLPKEIKKNGSYIAYKYVFEPSSLFSPSESSDPGSPIFFYLLRMRTPELTEEDFDAPLTAIQENKILQAREETYHCIHAAFEYFNRGEFDYTRNLTLTAADRGNPLAQYNVAYMLENTIGGNQDLPLAKHYYQLAADQGHPLAQLNYAFMLESGSGGEFNLPKARYYYKLSADQGNSDSQFNLAYMYETGLGGNQDFLQARHYYRLSALQGNIEAKFEIGQMLQHGIGGVKDFAQARHFFKLAADQGHVESQFRYAEMSEKGEGGNQDSNEALLYYSMAASHSCEAAQSKYNRLLSEIRQKSGGNS